MIEEIPLKRVLSGYNGWHTVWRAKGIFSALVEH